METVIPLTKAVLFPVAVKSNDPMAFTSDVLTDRPHNRVTGSRTEERHTFLQFDPEMHKITEVKNKTIMFKLPTHIFHLVGPFHLYLCCFLSS